MADDFNWDSFEDAAPVKASDSFEWDKFDDATAEDLNPIEAKDNIGKLESNLKGTQQGITGGFADELGGGIQSSLDALYSLVGESPSDINRKLKEQGFTGDIGPTSSKEVYTTARDENRADYKAAQEANPWSYGAGNLAGGVLSTVATSPLLTAKGAGALARIGEGAATGGIFSLGSSEADLTKGEFGDAAIDTALGAASGAGLSYALPTLFSNKALGKGVGFVDSAKKMGTAALAGGVGGAAIDLVANDELDPTRTLKSAGLGAGAALGARGLYRAGATIPEVFPNTANLLSSAYSYAAKTGNALTEKLKAVESTKLGKLVKKTANLAQEKINEFEKSLTSAKNLVLDKKAAQSKQGQQALVRLANDLDSTVNVVKKDLDTTFGLVKEQTKNVAFTPGESVEKWIAELPRMGVFNDLTDAAKQGMIDKLRHDAYTGKVSFKNLVDLKHTIWNLKKAYPKASSELNALYGAVAESGYKAIKEAGLDETANLLQTANQRYSKLMDLGEVLSFSGGEPALAEQIANRNSRFKTFSKFGDEAPLEVANADDIINTAGITETPKKELTGLLNKAKEEAKGLAQAEAKLTPQQLALESQQYVDETTKNLQQAISELQQILGKGASDLGAGGVQDVAKVSAQNKLIKLIEGSLNPANPTTRHLDLKRVYEGLRPVLGSEITDNLMNPAIDAAKVIEQVNIAVRDPAFEQALSRSGIAKVVLGPLSSIAVRTANWLGRRQFEAMKATKDLMHDPTITQGLISRAEGSGKTALANILKKLNDKEGSSKAAIIFTMMQRPDIRADLNALADEEK